MKCASCKADLPEQLLYCPECDSVTRYHLSFRKQISPRKASLFLFYVATLFLSIVSGLLLKTIGRLPDAIFTVASYLGVALISITGTIGIKLGDYLGKKPVEIWKNAHKGLVLGLSILLVSILTLLIYAIPLLQSDPYTHGEQYGISTLVFHDSLTSASQANWAIDRNPLTKGGCSFTSTGYSVTANSTNVARVCTRNLSFFKNFVYEVTMTIMKGDCGGIEFRDSVTQSYGYVSLLCKRGISLDRLDSAGRLHLISSVNLTDYIDPAIRDTRTNKTNTLAIVTSGEYMDIWLNFAYIGRVFDSTNTQGDIGVVADDVTQSTTVSFHDATLWRLPD